MFGFCHGVTVHLSNVSANDSVSSADGGSSGQCACVTPSPRQALVQGTAARSTPIRPNSSAINSSADVKATSSVEHKPGFYVSLHN